MKKHLFLSLIAITLSSHAFAEIYKRVDADGRVTYSNIKSKLIISTLTDKNGDFCVELPEGKYSIMVREEGKGLWANIFDGEENIFPFEVKKEKNPFQVLEQLKSSPKP